MILAKIKFKKVFNAIKGLLKRFGNGVINLINFIKIIIHKINIKLTKNRIIKTLIIAIMLAICFIIIYIYNYVARRSMIVTDDFDHYNIIKDMSSYIDGEHFHNAIEYAKWDCINLGGRYFTMFIQCFFGLRDGIDYIANQSTIMSWNVILWFGSLLYVIFSFVHNFSNCKKQVLNQIVITLYIYMSFIISFNCFNYYPQIFNWFPGATSYSIPLSCFFISLGSMLYLINYDNLIFILLSFIFGICSMGGSLCIVSTSITILSIVFTALLISKRINMKFFILMGNHFLFALINIISPGNYNRRVITIGDEYTFLNILNTSLSYINARIKTIFFNPFSIVLILAFAGLLGFIIIKYFKLTYSCFVIFPLIILLPLATTLPIALGFGNLSLYNQIGVYDRICFAIDFSLLFVFFYIFTLIYLSITYIINNANNIIVCLCLMILVCSALLYQYREYMFFNDIHIIEMTDNIIQKKYDTAYSEYVKMMIELERNRGAQYLTVSKPKTIVTHYYNFESRGYENEFFEIKNLSFK